MTKKHLTAVILAAGFGNRMKPLTNEIHKTLLTVNKKAIIDRIVDGLLENRVDNIIVALGYRAEELKSYLDNKYGAVCSLQYVENDRYRETNNIHTLALVFERCKIQSDMLLIESDLIYEPDVIRCAIESPFENVALVDRYRSGMDGTVVAIDDNIVTNVIPPHLQGPSFRFDDKYKTLNIYKFSLDFCERFFKKLLMFYSATIDDNCYYELILGFLIYMQRDSIHAENIEGLEWAEVDDPNDLRIAEFQFNKGQRTEIIGGAWGGYWSYPLVDFAFIRNMYFPTPSIFSEIRNNLDSLLQNYGSSQDILNEKMGYFLLLPKEKIIALNGASQVFPILKSFFADSQISIPKPGFGEYARIFEGAECYVDNIEEYADNFIRIAKQDAPDVIVVTNPNNPTGSIIPSRIVADSIVNHGDKFFIVDESFIDFSDEDSVVKYLDDDVENFIIVKSLSKSLGVPGARLGYVYTNNQDLYDYIHSHLPIWSLNSVAENFLEILLKHRRVLEDSIAKTNIQKKKFAALLGSVPLISGVYGAGGNYLLVKVNIAPVALREWTDSILANHDILLKDVSDKFSDGQSYLRIAVRHEQENTSLVEKFHALSSQFGF